MLTTWATRAFQREIEQIILDENYRHVGSPSLALHLLYAIIW